MRFFLTAICLFSFNTLSQENERIVAKCDVNTRELKNVQINILSMAKNPEEKYSLGAPFLVELAKFNKQKNQWIPYKTYSTIKGQSMVRGTYLSSFEEIDGKTYIDFQMHIWPLCESCAQKIAKYSFDFTRAAELAFWEEENGAIKSAQAAMAEETFPCLLIE